MTDRVVCAGPGRFLCYVGMGHVCGAEEPASGPHITAELTVPIRSGMMVQGDVESPLYSRLERTIAENEEVERRATRPDSEGEGAASL